MRHSLDELLSLKKPFTSEAKIARNRIKTFISYSNNMGHVLFINFCPSRLCIFTGRRSLCVFVCGTHNMYTKANKMQVVHAGGVNEHNFSSGFSWTRVYVGKTKKL
jgi:hypothetical protein